MVVCWLTHSAAVVRIWAPASRRPRAGWWSGQAPRKERWMRRLLPAIVALALALLAMVPASVFAQTPSSTVLADLAPTGALRFAMPLDNSALVTKDAATGELRGVAADLARTLVARLGVPL